MAMFVVDGRYLKKARRELGLSNRNPDREYQRDEPHGALNTAYATLCQYEQARARISDRELARIFRELRVAAAFKDRTTPRQPGATYLAKVEEYLVEMIGDANDRLYQARLELLNFRHVAQGVNALSSLMSDFSDEAEALRLSLAGQAEEADRVYAKRLAMSVRQAADRATLAKSRGDNWFRNGRYELAMREYQESLKWDPSQERVRLRAAQSYLSESRNTSANQRAARELLKQRVSARLEPERATWMGILAFHDVELPYETRLRKAERIFTKAHQRLLQQGDDIARAMAVGFLGCVKCELARLELGGLELKPAAPPAATALKHFLDAHECLKQAVTIWDRQDNPFEWAISKMRLGLYKLHYPETDYAKRRDDLDEAHKDFNRAFKVLQVEGFTIECARLELNRSHCYIQQAKHLRRNKARYCDRAATAARAAIALVDMDAQQIWGYAHYNLAESLLIHPNANPESLKEAVAALQETLRVYPRKFQHEWAGTHFLLAQVHARIATLQFDAGNALESRRSFESAIASIKGATSMPPAKNPDFDEHQRESAALRLRYVEQYGASDNEYEQIASVD